MKSYEVFGWAPASRLCGKHAKALNVNAFAVAWTPISVRDAVRMTGFIFFTLPKLKRYSAYSMVSTMSIERLERGLVASFFIPAKAVPL